MTGCNIYGTCLIRLDVDSAGMETDIDLTFVDWDYPKSSLQIINQNTRKIKV
ncbi:MAG: hypothetical protein PWP56_2094 [Acetobacterium sp.]|jgi:hypothetical protein|nr:hypothetical protein [Eubacteriaceae bacterium]MDK2904397.1 hypothetical protein [Eubacteriaceae bacterium]MDK2942581.1 hypothetical protein [Acetobacterium sp.]